MLARLLAVLLLAAPASALARQPNIVVIMSDDQPDIETLETMPTLRREMARKGVTFRNSFVDFSLCCPSRASFLTGLSAHNHHILGNTDLQDGGFGKFYALGWERHTLGRWLRGAGYRTAFIGKYLNQYPLATGVAANHVPPGWSEWRAYVRGAHYSNYELNENGTLVQYGSGDANYSTDVLTDKAVDFIRRQANRTVPFFLLVTPNAPHTGRATIDGVRVPEPATRHRGKFSRWPFPRSPSFNEADVSDKPGLIQSTPRLDRPSIGSTVTSYRLMRETLLAVDDMVGAVLGALTASGKLDNTIVVFTSDNGFLYGQHRLIGKQAPYEQSIRVPLMIRGPGIPQGKVRRQMVNNLDVVATLVAAAGATPTLVLDGQDLTPVLSNAAVPWRTVMLVHGADWDINQTLTLFSAVRTPRHLYVRHDTTLWGTEHELYDLRSDPDQLTNVAGEPGYLNLLARLQAALTTLKTCSGASCWYTQAIAPVGGAPQASGSRAPVYRGPVKDLFGARLDYDKLQAAHE